MIDYKGSAKIAREQEGIKEQINEMGPHQRSQKNYKNISGNKGACFR